MTNVEKFKPITFYPYTSFVTKSIFRIEYTYNSEEKTIIEDLRRDLIKLFNDSNIKSITGCTVVDDNKIVFEIEYNGIKLFYGFYDWEFTIGLGVYSDYLKYY